ncbi:tumor necrosis factor ligand superfamily member 18 [Brienomyrus brachyistius]|uniref:tumor necrosis factor ligand superfamily member 18 n=1 Tax=Brienomyrus brachyistius TaxID=42636 RepID=UPI0020B30117|nr:tumor necrosis factor ligand superfamily member 18 [Brienomyrus brachyistius]
MSSTETALHQALARHQCLNNTLMLWVTFLSLAQAITLALLFILAWPMQDASRSPCLCEPANTTQQFLVNFLKHGSDQTMGEIPWMSENGIQPVIAKDGRYFLYIQVTLQSHAANLTYTVHVKKSNTVLISLTLTKKSDEITTGFHGRQVPLGKDDELKVTCAPPALINTTQFATFMGTHLTEAF